MAKIRPGARSLAARISRRFADAVDQKVVDLSAIREDVPDMPESRPHSRVNEDLDGAPLRQWIAAAGREARGNVRPVWGGSV